MGTSRAKTRRHGQEADGVRFERLEGRMLLSGNVTAVVSDGNLIITGDDHANEIVIDQVGVGTGEVNISGVGTTVNDDPAVTLLGITGNVLIRMGRGNDEVQILDVDLPGNLTVNDVGGNSVLVLDATTVAGKMVVSGKRGDQTLQILNGSDIARNLTVRNDRGDNLTQVLSSSVGGQLNISGKQGIETVELDAVTIGSHVKVRHQKGDTDVGINDADIGGHLMVLTGKDEDLVALGGLSEIDGKVDINIKNGGGAVTLGGTVHKQVKILAGKGIDDITLTGLTAHRNVRVHTSDGRDSVVIDDVIVSGPVHINTGKNDDTVSIETLGLDDTGPGSAFNGNVHISTFAGDDVITIGALDQDYNSADMNGGVKIDGGKDTDTLDWLDGGNGVSGTPLLKGIEAIL